jgi:hypothetical protein
MLGRTGRTALAIAGLLASTLGSAADQPTVRLSAEDIAAIRQLTARYAHVVDTCVNSGYDYADLFTEDGTFGVTDQWDVAGTIWARGWEALARAGGGGPDGCRPKRPGTPGYGLHHIVTSEVVEAAPGGARGRSVLVTLGVDGTPGSIEWQGGYQDRYVKTAKGWRIQSRWHVWPDYRTSVQLARNPLPAALLPPSRSKPAEGH